MTKKEQAAMAALEEEIRLLKAWRTTEKVEPDIAPPELRGGKYTFGWLSFGCASLYYRAEVAASSCGSHYTGSDLINQIRANPDRYYSGTQREQHLHSKRSDALKLARYSIEQDVIRALANLDKEIAEAMAQEAEDFQ